MKDQVEVRQIAIRASMWTVLLIGFAISISCIARGIVEGRSDLPAQVGMAGAVLVGVVAATLYVADKIERSMLTYKRGFRDGFTEARDVNSVLMFPTEREPSRS